MANQENTKSLTDHLNNVNERISQARGVIQALASNCNVDSDGINFRDYMTFDDVMNAFWAASTLLDQARECCNNSFTVAYAIQKTSSFVPK